MKKALVVLLLTVIVLLIAGYQSDKPSLSSGTYEAVGFEEPIIPYLWIDTSENQYTFGPSGYMSIAAYWTYTIASGVIIAPYIDTTFKFEIKDENTLELVDVVGDIHKSFAPVNTQFVLHRDSEWQNSVFLRLVDALQA